MKRLAQRVPGNRRRFFQEDRGSTIIEYAFVLPPLILLIMGTLEFSIVLYLRSAVEETVRSVARVAITGADETDDATRSQTLEQLMREKLAQVVIDDSKITISSRVYESYSSFNVDSGRDSVTPDFGSSNEIVRYTINYEHEFLTPLPRLISNFNQSMIISSTVFAKNEVF